jgi:hypothetical protein
VQLSGTKRPQLLTRRAPALTQAKAVLQYLAQHGLPRHKVRFSAFGCLQPGLALLNYKAIYEPPSDGYNCRSKNRMQDWPPNLPSDLAAAPPPSRQAADPQSSQAADPQSSQAAAQPPGQAAAPPPGQAAAPPPGQATSPPPGQADGLQSGQAAGPQSGLAVVQPSDTEATQSVELGAAAGGSGSAAQVSRCMSAFKYL